MEYDDVLRKLEGFSDPSVVVGMARFGINLSNSFGVSVPNIRKIAKDVGRNHGLALELWLSGVREARILATMVDNHVLVDGGQMDAWVLDFDSWDVCDQCCMNLFWKTEFAWGKAVEWSFRSEEFVKRAGFVMMASLAVHDKSVVDDDFLRFFPIIKEGSSDERNFVRKAVNWALRQIGKRSAGLNVAAIGCAREIRGMDSKSAMWIANDAIRELESDAVRKRLGIF